MKRLVILYLLALVGLVSSVSAQSRASAQTLDAENGLLKATFGMAPGELKGLKLISTEGPKQVYEQLSQKPTLGGYTLARIHYTFYQDQLCAIKLAVAGKANNDGVLRTLQRSYGPGAAEGHTHTWQGARVSLIYGTMGQNNGVVTLTSKPLVAQMRQDATKGNTGRSTL